MKQVTSVEQGVRATLVDVAARNAALHIFTAVDESGALAAARSSDARLAAGKPLSAIDGVTVSVKDNIDVAGLPTTAGLGFRRAAIAARDAFVVARLRTAGAVILGKVNMHAAAFGATNHNADFGDCDNPAHPGCVPGGSSGGSAASVAVGWAQLSLGTDTMGSVRLPASYCGTAGFKPTFGVISTAGVVPLCARLDHVGLLAASIPAIEAGFAVAAGFDSTHPWARSVTIAPPVDRRLRLRAVLPGGPTEIASSIWRRFEVSLAAIRALGHTISRFESPAQDPGAMRRAGLLLSEAEMLVTYAREWRSAQEEFPSDMRAAMRWAEGKSASDAARAEATMAEGVTLLRAMRAGADCLLMPTTPQSAFSRSAPAPANQADLCCLANFEGAPAASLPMRCGADERAAGLQVIGAPGADLTVLALCREIESAIA